MSFGEQLREARLAAGLTQAEVSLRSGVARPNVAAYEAGRRQPLYSAGVALLDLVGCDVLVEEPIQWSWVGTLRPFAVPSRLWRLPVEQALRSFEAPISLWWSGPPRRFDLASRADRLRVYELALREAGPLNIEALVDGLLLAEAWPDLSLPNRVAEAWAPLVMVEPARAQVHAP